MQANTTVNSDYPAWKAFNHSESLGWEGAAVDTGWYIMYFPVPVKINQFSYGIGTNWYIRDFYFQYSDNGETWVNLGQFTYYPADYTVLNIPNEGYHKYYRVMSTFAYRGTGMNNIWFKAYYKDGADPIDNLWASPNESKYIIKAWK